MTFRPNAKFKKTTSAADAVWGNSITSADSVAAQKLSFWLKQDPPQQKKRKKKGKTLFVAKL